MTKKKNSSIKSMLWSILSRYLPNLFQIISTIIIARLVTPQEFGEVALVTVFIQMANLFITSGLAEALIYRGKNTKSLYSTVFYVNVLIATLLYVILFLMAKNISDFYQIDRLEILTKIIGLNMVMFSFTFIHKVLYLINENFKTPAIIAVISSVIGSLVGVYLAFKGYGVWALVCQTLLITFIQLLLFWKLSNWRPSFTFSKKELLLILPYSSKIFFNNIVQTLYDNIYTLVIGKVYSSGVLGYYNRMQTLVYFTTTNFMFAIENVFFPMLSKKKKDLNHLKESHEVLIRISTFVAFPILVILISLGEPIIIVLLSSKWLGSLQILKLLSIAYLFVPIIYINNSFLKIINKPNVLFYGGLIKKLIGMLLLIITISYDIEYVLYGIILYYIIDSIISMTITHFLVKINIIKQIGFILNNMLLNVVFFLILKYVSSFFTDDFTKIFISIFVGGVFYVTLPVVLKLKEFRILKQLLLNKK